MKYNNATFGSISYIYIDDTDANSTDYSDVFATLAQDDFIIVNDATDSSKSAVFKIAASGVVDSGGYWSINVTPISGTISADGNYQDIRVVRQSVAGTDTQGVDQWTLIGVAGETPVAQQASFNAASGGSVTSIKLSYQSDAYNLDDWLKTWSTGDFLVIKDTASAKHLVKEIVSVTDDPGNSLITIVATEVSSSGTFGGTETLDVIYESRGNSVHTDVPSELDGLTGKSNPVDNDLLLIEDSAAGYAKKKLLLSNLLATLSTQQGFGIWQYTGDADTTPASGGFSFDTSGIAIADHIYVHENNASGMDMALVLGSLKVNDIIYIGHSSLKTVGSMHKLTGTPTLTANVWDIPIDGATSGATSSPNWVLNDFAYFVVLTADTAGAGANGAGMAQNAYVAGGGAPAAAKLTANADLLSSVVALNLSDSTSVDNSFSIAYGAIKAGDYIVIRDNAGGGAHGTFLVASSVDNTTYWTFTVTAANVSGSFVDGNDYDIFVLSRGVHFKTDSASEPSVTDDVNANYRVGDIWITTSATERRAFVCVDATAGAASWVRILLLNSGTDTSAGTSVLWCWYDRCWSPIRHRDDSGRRECCRKRPISILFSEDILL